MGRHNCSRYLVSLVVPPCSCARFSLCSHYELSQTEKEGLQKEVERWSVRCKEAQANQNNDGLAADLEKVKKLSMEGLRKVRAAGD